MREFAESILKKCKEEQDIIADSVSSGACSDFPAYRFSVGEVEGLNKAIDVIRDEFNKIIKEDEEDE